MQHLHISNPHMWSTPEKSIAVEYTLKQTTKLENKKDYVSTLLYKLLRASQSNVTKGESEAARKTRPYLGAVLPLTRIIYHALGKKEMPKPWDKSADAKIGSKTAPGSRPAQKTKKPVMPKKTSSTGRKQKIRSEESQQEKVAKEPAQKTDEEEEEEMLLQALSLSKSEAGTSSIKTTSQ